MELAIATGYAIFGIIVCAILIIALGVQGYNK